MPNQNLKLKIFFLTIIFCGVFGVAENSSADTHTASSCSLVDVTTAYNAASSGDTIAFPLNSACTWSSALTVGKALTIDGNGTTLTASGSLSDGFFLLNNFTSSTLMRINGFTFQMINATPIHAIYYGDTLSLANLRIDHNTFHFGQVAIEIGGSKGVVDNNYFYNGIKAIQFTAGTRAQADASWVSMAAGTSDALFIEDNHFIDNASYPNDFSQEKIGTHNGGKLVVRHNEWDSDAFPLSVTAGYFETHGSAAGGCANGYWQQGSGCRRGQSVVEFYNNTMHGKRIDWLATLRGSANLVHDNTITSIAGNPRIQLREEEYYESSNWSPLRTAWPAEDQIHNSFFWNNTSNGTQMNSSLATYYYLEDNLLKDRDFFLHAPCAAGDSTDEYGNVCTHGKETFTGANGASASYPTDGSVYPNAGNMIFTATGDNAYLDYVPYTYPHPLQGETDITPPASPSGLSVE